MKDFKRESVCENVWHGGALAGELKGGQQHGVCMKREGNKVENKGLWMVIGLGFFDVAHHISFKQYHLPSQWYY